MRARLDNPWWSSGGDTLSDHDRLPSWALSRRQLFKLTAATGVVASVPQIVTAPPSAAATTRLSGLAYAQANRSTRPPPAS